MPKEFYLSDILTEMTPAEQAKNLGLVYLGFGGWGDPVTRTIKAKTVQGHLVRTDGDGANSQEDLGRLDVMFFSTAVAHHLDKLKGTTQLDKFGKLINALIKVEGTFILLYNAEVVKQVAEYLVSIGIKSGIKMKSLQNPNSDVVKDFIKEKIKMGFRDIHFYDTDKNDVEGVKSLRAPYNKVKNLVIDPHWIAELDTTTSDTNMGL
jgi:hypothetical protein